MPPVLSSPDALRLLRAKTGPGARIYVPGVAAEPYGFAESFLNEPELADGLTFFGIWVPGVNRTDWAGLHPTARAATIFLAPEWQASFRSGQMALRPLTYTQAWRWLDTTPVDAALLQVSPPDAHGQCSLSLASDFTPAIWQRAGVRIGQINPALPSLPNAPSIPLDAFDAVVDQESLPRGFDAGSLPPAFAKIAQQIAGLVDDGDIVQFGLGKVQLAVLPALHRHRGLLIHSGMVSEPLLALLDGETVTAIRTGAILGSPVLARRLASDARLTMAPVLETHSAAVLAGLKRFTAINSLIEIDLFGQGNGEFLAGRQVSGGGGLLDFARGAQASPGGRAIFALASTAQKGTLSRIVPRLDVPAVTLPRPDIEIVVTEHGVADLRGLDLDARASALTGIADPAFRSMLAHEWTRIRRSL